MANLSMKDLDFFSEPDIAPSKDVPGPLRDEAVERATLIADVALELNTKYKNSDDPFGDMAKAMVERFAPEPELPDFMVTNQLVHCENLDTANYSHDNNNSDTDDLSKANLISSKVKGTTRHKPIFDLDFEAALLPSSTEGHYHLYLDKELTNDQMERLVRVLHEIGILAQGNLNQWTRNKAQFLRVPWVRKTKESKSDTPKGVW